jgi:hypothetical protein
MLIDSARVLVKNGAHDVSAWIGGSLSHQWVRVVIKRSNSFQ